MGRGNPAFFMPGEQPTTQVVHKDSSGCCASRRHAESGASLTASGWRTEALGLLIKPILGHLPHTGIKRIARVELPEERGVLGLRMVLIAHVMLGRVFGADLIQQ